MKNLLFLLSLFLTITCYSQKSETTIDYELFLTSSLESVGGDLVIIDDDSPINLAPCINKKFNNEVLFQGDSAQTIYIKVDNRGAENNCVTLTVVTTSGTKKIEVAEDDQTGVLRFNKVTKAFLSITKGELDANDETLSSLGKATIWF